MTRTLPDRGLTALYRPTCSQLFVIFQGGTGTLMMDPTEFMREAQLFDRNLMMLRDKRLTWYLRDVADNIPNSEALVAYLRRVRDLMAPREVYCIGTCMGGWAAMYYGYIIGANEVWAFAPSAPGGEQIQDLRTHGIEPPDLVALLKRGSGIVKQWVYYCEESFDSVFSEALAGCPGVTSIPVPGGTHRVLAVLRDQGKLKTLFPSLALKS